MNRSCMVIAIGVVLLGTASLSADGPRTPATGSEDNRVAQAPPFGFPGWDSRGGSYDRGRRVEDPRDRQPEPARDPRAPRPSDNRQAAPPFMPPWMRAPAAPEPPRRPAAAPQSPPRPFTAPAPSSEMRAWMDRWRSGSSSSRTPSPFAGRFGASSRAPERGFASRSSGRGRPAMFAGRCGGGRGFVSHRFGRGPMQARGFSGRASFGAFRPWSRGFGGQSNRGGFGLRGFAPGGRGPAFGGRGPAFGFGGRGMPSFGFPGMSRQGDWRSRTSPAPRTPAPAPRTPAAPPRAPEPPRRPTEGARPSDLERRLDRVLQEIEDMRRELRRR